MKKIVIIGAGPAGITAGYELIKRSKDYEVVILEESNVVGGISQTVNYKGNRMDIGGHRFFSKDQRVTNWWEDLLPTQSSPAFDYKNLGIEVRTNSKGNDPEKSDLAMLVRNRVSRIFYRRKFFDYPMKMSLTTIKNLGFFTTFIAGISYLFACLKKLPETSLENFYINRFGRKLYSMFFEGYTEKLWGRHPKDISADWGAQRVKGLSIVAIIKDVLTKPFRSKGNNQKVETSLIQEFSYPKFGPGQLWEYATKEFTLGGGIVKFNAKVIGFKFDDQNVSKVFWQDNEGTTHEEICDKVISSMPLKDLVAAMPKEVVPTDVSKIAQGLPYRDFVTVGVLVDKLALKNETAIKTLNNIVPDNWIYVQDTGVKMGRIQIFNNWSPYMVADPNNTVWIGLENFCSEGDEYWTMPDTKWRDLGVSELKKIGVIDNSTKISDFNVVRVKKAYPAYFDTYKEIDKLVNWLNTVDNLYCVGRNGQHRYNNMDHSMETAFQTVDNILSGKTTKENIWNVNTEKSYHETKDRS